MGSQYRAEFILEFFGGQAQVASRSRAKNNKAESVSGFTRKLINARFKALLLLPWDALMELKDELMDTTVWTAWNDTFTST